MTNKSHSCTLLVTLAVLVAFFAGCSREATSLAATNLQAADYSKDAPTLSNEAYELIQKGELKLAAAKAELAVRKDPNFGEAQKNLALAYCDLGRIKEALPPAQAAVRLSPNFDKAHFVLGKIFTKLDRLDEAIAELQQAIRINPKYDKAYYLLGTSYDLLNKPQEAQAALDKWVELKPEDLDYRSFRDSVVAYVKLKKNGTAFPKIVAVEGTPDEYGGYVYSGTLHQALVHHDFELIERAAAEARASKEKLSGGGWKLQLAYAGVDRPYWARSDFEWQQHIDLLRQWTKAKPESITAKVALASCLNKFAWNARGTGFANKVAEENYQLFSERVREAEKILWSVEGEKNCPVWYSVMQQIALAEGWDRDSHEKLYDDAVQHEPTFYDFYRQKLISLLPRWQGAPGEAEAYMNSFAVQQGNPQSAIVHFMVNETFGAFDPTEQDKPSAYYSVLKQGYLDMRKAFGVTERDKSWIFHKSIATKDKEFSVQLYGELKNKSDLPLRVDKELFDVVVKEFEKSKP